MKSRTTNRKLHLKKTARSSMRKEILKDYLQRSRLVVAVCSVVTQTRTLRTDGGCGRTVELSLSPYNVRKSCLKNKKIKYY
jgi:hypothetical protein